MGQVIWTEPALDDVNEVAEFIALDNIPAANKLVQNFFSNTERLEYFPESGRKPPELDNSRYRELIVNPCRIFYRVENDITYILYFMRSEKSLRNLLLEERANKIS